MKQKYSGEAVTRVIKAAIVSLAVPLAGVLLLLRQSVEIDTAREIVTATGANATTKQNVTDVYSAGGDDAKYLSGLAVAPAARICGL